MTLAQALWRENVEIAERCRHHPFVRGIADGSLPSSIFEGYVAQDGYFLEAFARAYAVASAKAPDIATFRALHALATGVLDELNLHARYVTSLGIALDDHPPLPATRRYTDFLLATAWSSSSGLTAAAMTPCMRLYAFLGTDIASGGTPAHAYTDWVQMYSSPDFESLAAQLESLLDRLAPPEQVARTHYRYAMSCELDFFQAAWEVGR